MNRAVPWFAAIPITAALLSSPVVYAQDIDAAFQPDGKWRLNELDDGCSVSRDFVRGEERATLSLKRIHPGADVQFAVIGAGITPGDGPIEARFLPGGAPSRHKRLAEASIGEREGIVFSGPLFVDADKSEKEARAREVIDFEVDSASGRKIVLHTRALDRATEALDGCVDDKLAGWGLDLERHRNFRTHAQPLRIAEWARELQRNYPAEALRNGWDGSISFRLIVDEGGRARHCHVTDYLAARVLREAACDSLLEHARFTPATDADGRPVVDYYWQQIRYSMTGGAGFSSDAHGFRIDHD